MNDTVREFSVRLGRDHCDQPRVLFDTCAEVQESNRWRAALRHAGVPILELNHAPAPSADKWLQAATDFSGEFMMPVVVFGASSAPQMHEPLSLMATGITAVKQINDPDWLHTRQVALTRAVEMSALNQEFRRDRDRKGWIRVGWQSEAALGEGNGLLLAWSSPLPLRRIRDFAARCPQLTLIAPDAEAIAAAVTEQGISVNGWRFAVK